MKKSLKIVVVDTNKERLDGYERVVKNKDLDLYFKEKTIKVQEETIRVLNELVDQQKETIALQDKTIKNLIELSKM